MRKLGGVIMKKTILVLCAISAFMVAQEDAAGSYKLTAVDVLYTYITRAENVLTVTDAYQMGVTVPVSTIPAAVPFTTIPMQLNDDALSAIGINLNVTLNEDGSGEVADGSYYPDVNTIQAEDGSCVTLQQVLPVNDPFLYSSMGNMMEFVGMAHPGVNVLGLPGISPMAGAQMGGLQLEDSETFEDFPMFPAHATMCDPTGEDCFPFTVGDLDGSGTVEVYPNVNLLGIPEYVPGGAPLSGLTAGYWLKEGVNIDEITSIYPGNTDPDFHLEWHGVDGSDSGLGWGDDDSDEDGDGTWFDRTVGIPGIPATYMNPACGFNLPIFGDVTAAFSAIPMDANQDGSVDAGDLDAEGNPLLSMATACIDAVGAAASGYLMNPAESYETWNQFVTGNAVQFGGCLAGGGDMATCGGLFGANDSGHDFNGTSGRLTFNFDVPCVGVIEAREVIAEFIEVGTGGCGSGDVNEDGSHNVMDVIALVNCVLDDDCNNCVGDMNADGSYTVNDIVALVNCVLNDACGGARVDSATSAEFNVIGNEVSMTADGLVGGIQMTLSHGSDFALKLTDGGQFSDYSSEGNTTTLIIVNPANGDLFTTSGDFTIESVLVSDFSGENNLSTSVNMPSDFSISAAYPNPFNPTTQMTLALHTQADVSVKVFNMAGQLVDVIAEGQMDRGSYSLTWDGTNASSGVYFVKTEVGSVIQSQKIMFIK